ncbi:hypothetical protein CA54_05220 [Symmachiella macrocystis]|uniref:Uncharacterized protein n=1 Tax=Symmachiella macrocystis TaxID=2527985 RepID=A0A5C6BHS1_9PLAN|nr:hypothetical protein CA54_05220 [Symmachiella macrocystis]
MSRWVNLAILVIFLLTVSAGVFYYFTSPSMGYPKSTAGIIAGLLGLVGLALLPSVFRKNSSESVAGEALPAKTGWGVFIGFLIVMAAVIAYSMLREQ